METSELKTFVYVANHQSFSIAADKLFLTQPAVSKRIASLEHKLGTRLFDRIGHKVSLTHAGKELYKGANAILLTIKDLQKDIRNISGEIEGALIIGASHHIGLRRLPPALKVFSNEHNKVDLDIRFIDSEQAAELINKGDIELALVTLPKNKTSNMHYQKIWDDPLHIVCAQDHPLACYKKIQLDDLARYKAILPSEKTYTRRIIEEHFKQAKLPIETAMNTNYLETIKMMVSIGMGWCALPKTMVDDSLHILTIKELSLHRELGCIYHKERTLSNAASAILTYLNSVSLSTKYS